ncbi:MAG: hypothetical protein SPI34_01480, partial [Opitutales bacterium]|nr:hypothetical protein [Opitutales bacterium]
VLKNGELKSRTGLPTGWGWYVSGKANAKAFYDDESEAFTIQNNSDKYPNVYAMLFQKVALKPDKCYLIEIDGEYSGEGTPLIVYGENWRIRAAVKVVHNKRNTSLTTILPKAKDLDKNGLSTFRILIEAKAKYTIHSISLTECNVPVITQSKPNLRFYNEMLEKCKSYAAKINELKSDASGINHLYLNAATKILSEHIAMANSHLAKAKSLEEKQYYAEKFNMIIPELDGAISDALGTLQKIKSCKAAELYTTNSDEIKIVNGWPYSTLVDINGNKITNRPVIYAGFGHFEKALSDLPIMQAIGANIIQTEIGPNSVFLREGKTSEFEADYAAFDKKIGSALKTAYENNVKVIVLLSPHYHPKWFAQKYGLGSYKNGFFKYDIESPAAQRMLDAFFKAMGQRLQQSPYKSAIHSICITNEPLYSAGYFNNPNIKPLFEKYFAVKYGNIKAFNQIAKTSFKDVNELLENADKNRAAKYAFYDFCKRRFADWHLENIKRLKSTLKADIPCHAKLMAMTSPFHFDGGIDLEYMSELGSYNGNDDIFYPEGKWASQWDISTLAHEIQTSANNASVVNSENHIISDFETRPIDNLHIYASLMHQFVGGVSALTTWVYQDWFYPNERKDPSGCLAGNIYLRCGNLVYHAKAYFDALRNAEYLEAFMRHKGSVAFLFSPTSVIHGKTAYFEHNKTLSLNDNYEKDLRNTYAKICLAGYKPQSITERDLENFDIKNAKVLFASSAKTITRKAALKLKELAENKTLKIYAKDGALKYDEFGNELGFKIPFLPEPKGGFLSEISKTVPQLLKFTVSGKSENDGVFVRAVPHKNSVIAFIANYNKCDTEIALYTQAKIYDLIDDSPAQNSFKLKPRQVKLLKLN